MFKDSEKISRFFLILALTIPATLLTQEKPAMVPQNPPQQAIQKTSDGPVINAVNQNSPGPIDPYVVAGGGGTSAGSSFVLDGTIGQSPAASPMSGGTFTMTSGFWPSLSDVAAPKKRRGQITSQ
jgi:hypothetical protein